MADRPTRKKAPRANRPDDAREGPRFVRRPKSERKALSPELEAFAASDEERFRPKRERSPRLVDARPDAPVPGVGNRDARDVYELHRHALAPLVEEREGALAREALAQGLALVIAADIFKAQHIASFEAFAVDVLGLPLDEAQALADEGAQALGLPGHALRPETIAAFFRAEAALLEAELDGVVGLAVDEDGAERLILDLDGPHAPRAIYAMGRKLAPLAIDQEKIEERRAEREAARLERELAGQTPDVDESPAALDAEGAALGALEKGFAPPRRGERGADQARDRPRFDRDERRGRDERGPRFGGRDDRRGRDERGPRFGGRDDRRGRDERRPRFGGRDDRRGRDERGPRFGGRDERPRRAPAARDERWGGGGRGPSGSGRFEGEGKPRLGDREDRRPRFDDRDERRSRGFGDRPSRRFGGGGPHKKKGPSRK